MKLAKLRIENFRHLGNGGKPFELDFTDVLGRVRDFTLLVGPNTSSKTTVLDAIAAALGPSLEMPARRQGFKLSPRTVVSRGASQAKVTCWLRFDDEEIQTAKKVSELSGDAKELEPIFRIPAPEVLLTWTYPDLRERLVNSEITSAFVYNITSGSSSRFPWNRTNFQDKREDGLTECESLYGKDSRDFP